jgi:hypothetical protein
VRQASILTKSGTPFAPAAPRCRLLRQWDTTSWPRRVAGEIADFDPVALLNDRKVQKFIRRSDVFGLYALDRRSRNQA